MSVEVPPKVPPPAESDTDNPYNEDEEHWPDKTPFVQKDPDTVECTIEPFTKGENG